MLGKSEEIPERTLDATRMWNEAMISSEPAAQAVLAIAAVEMLAQDKQWSESQRSVIQSLVESLKDIDTLSKAEQEEVAEAMRRMHRHGIGQGIRRLLASLDLMPLWKRWDELYSKRSALLHGLTYSDRGAQSTMVYPALALSGRIVLTALSRHVPNAALGIDEIMPLPTV